MKPLAARCSDTLQALKAGPKGRDIYKTDDGRFIMSYRGGVVDADVVAELRRCGEIVSKYSDIPELCFHIGRTIDKEATLALRKKVGSKKAGLIYVGDI